MKWKSKYPGKEEKGKKVGFATNIGLGVSDPYLLNKISRILKKKIHQFWPFLWSENQSTLVREANFFFGFELGIPGNKLGL